ncbi:MAG: TonB-dependent receptor, partial [Cyclobacteriaceae bacterium]|nr:TonB-dependent receptor [Cyclobacteriaceae bacterium]
MKKNVLLAAVALLFSSVLFGQGNTTSSIRGRVVDANGEALPGATVRAIHTPTGSEWGAVSDYDGYYRLSNVNVGGPYRIEITYVGFEPQGQEGIYLSLGQTFNYNVSLSESATELQELVVTANADDVFDGNRTGAATFVALERINATPTVSRGLADFARLNPLANTQESAIEISGMNNRYNAIYIDGAVNNDVFGLAASGTNGGQTGVSPISVDAIEQLQISVAPFDVRQSGFAGGSINAVTRSGSNEVIGSAYMFTRNEKLTGKTPTDDPNAVRDKFDEYSAKVYGARVGGALIKNKLFYFVNAEFQREETPRPFDFATYTGGASRAQLDQLLAKLNGFGYDPGTFENNTSFLNSNKLIGKLDWNLNQDHKLSIRHSYVSAESLDANRSNTSTLNFVNSSVYFPSTTNSSALELKSVLGDNLSNHLTIGATFVNDDRDPSGDPFPYVSIQDDGGAILFGSEQFSTANQLKQNVITLTDNFEIYKGKHTFTLGTHNEFYKTYNLFIRQAFGSYQYDSLEGFLQDMNARQFDVSYSLVDNKVGDGSAGAAEFRAMQLGFYAQDEIQVSEQFKVTLGLRLDIPVFRDNTRENTDFNTLTVPLLEAAGHDLKGATTGAFIDKAFLFAPRIGFNYDITGDKSTQLRGGVGIFNSRVPLVWPGGAYNNNGLTVGGDRSFNVPF